ncbi:uncharacterized protein [Euphorbia lathyris]|uniref:uncharacterized protein isoform X2 n=1 Tax=Euphorbia lathyris TaxID=212925 RepID=UPI0033134E81
MFPQISPKFKPEVREEAMKLALEWKSMMKTHWENSMEVSSFLQLSAAFKLSSSFNRDELESLFDAISQNKQDLQLRQALGFAEGVSGKAITSNLTQLQSKATQASQFVAKHGVSYYKQILEQNKQHILEPPTVEKCNLLSKQLFYTHLAREQMDGRTCKG